MGSTLDIAKECSGQLRVAGRIAYLAKGGGQNAASLSGMKSVLKIMGVLDSDTVSRSMRPLTDEEKQGIPGTLEYNALCRTASNQFDSGAGPWRLWTWNASGSSLQRV